MTTNEVTKFILFLIINGLSISLIEYQGGLLMVEFAGDVFGGLALMFLGAYIIKH